MAFEAVRIQSLRNGASNIIGEREDLVAGDAMTLSLTNTAGITSVAWRMKGRPPFSTAGGAGPEPVLMATSFTTSFTVDADTTYRFDGAYLVEATINPGSVSEVRKTAMLVRVSGLTITGPDGQPINLRKFPGFEQLEDTKRPTIAQGGTPMLDFWLEWMRQNAGGGATLGTLRQTYVQGANATDQTLPITDVDGGGVVLDGSASSGYTGANVLRVNSLAGGPFVIARATGNIGKGTTTPVKDLHIAGAAPTLRLDRSGGLALDIDNASDAIDFMLAATRLARVLGTGGISTPNGVGIGVDPSNGDAVLTLASAPSAAVAPAGVMRIRDNAGVPEYSYNTGPWTPFATGTGQIIEVANATTLATTTITAQFAANGAVAHVLTFDDHFAYKPTSTATVRPGEVIAAAGGVGRWERMGTVSAKWRILAMSYSAAAYPATGGIFISSAGSVEGAGTSGDPIPMSEAVRRLHGHQFFGLANDGVGGGAPLLQIIGTVTEDVHIAGFTAEYVIISAVPTVMSSAGGLTIASVTDSDATGNPGTVAITGFDFTTRTSNSSRTCWIRRTNGAGNGGVGSTSWAQIFEGSSGSCLTGKQSFLFGGANFGAYNFSAGVRLFQAGDTVDIVNLPAVQGHITASSGISIALIIQQFDVDEFVAELVGAIDAMVIGTRQATAVFFSGRVRGAMCVGGAALGASVILGGVCVGVTGAPAGLTAGAGCTVTRLIGAGLGVATGVVLLDVSHFRNTGAGNPAIQVTNSAEVRCISGISGSAVGIGVLVSAGGKVGGGGNNFLSALYAASTVQAQIDGVNESPNVGPTSIINADTGSAIFV